MYMTGWVDFFYIVLLVFLLYPLGKHILRGKTKKEWDKIIKENEEIMKNQESKHDPDKIMGS